MWKDEKKNAKGHSLYPETIDAIENLLANLHGDWVAEIAVASGGTNEIFYLMAADREVNWDDVDWGEGISVICVMRYGSEGDEKESAYEMMATFQMDGREDYQKELEIITAMLRAWVEEKAFLNARMAVNIQDLLRIKGLHDYLVDSNYPAYICSRQYRP